MRFFRQQMAFLRFPYIGFVRSPGCRRRFFSANMTYSAGMPWWNMIFHGGISNSMVGNDIPRWETQFHGGKWWHFLLVYPASTPIHKGGGLRPPPQTGWLLEWIPLWMGVEAGLARRKSHRGISCATVEYHFPPWNLKPHCGMSY